MKKLLIIGSLAISLILPNLHVVAETVVFNVKAHKVHRIGCLAAARCTRNCIKIDRKVAYKKGGIPCKKCGG